MESDKKFHSRCSNWQVLKRPNGVMLRQDGRVLMSVSPENLSEVAYRFAGIVERSVNAMRGNRATVITFHVTWQ